MRNHSLSIAFVLAVMLYSSPAIFAQIKTPPKAPKAQVSVQRPDLSGVWMQDRPAATALQYWVYQFNLEEPPMTPLGEAQYKANKSGFGPHPVPIGETNDPIYKGCYPPGVPRIYLQPVPMQIVQTRDEVLMLFEYDSMRRQIFTDGRAHDTSLGPTWMGDSIAHWEGDTLVVDTTNFNDKTWIDRIGHPHSEALHVIERIRRAKNDHLLDNITIEDPKVYSKPWTTRLDFLLRPTWTLAERFCEEDASFNEIEKKEVAPEK